MTSIMRRWIGDPPLWPKPITLVALSTADLPKLVRLAATELKLVPNGILEATKGANIVRGILTNLATLTHGLA
jgi:hypothetical protein